MNISAYAGKPATIAMLVNVQELITAYYTKRPEPDVPAQQIAFGTSGHRGSSLQTTFNEWHILAISQAICLYRKWKKISGPLFLGMDTHALSVPALATTLGVLAANGVEVMLSQGDAFTPTPAISHAIITHNRHRRSGLADGIVITPSHNPPHDGGFKYNPPHGGPAESAVTNWIEAKANTYLLNGLRGVKRMGYDAALGAATTHRYDFRETYIADLGRILDMELIAKVHLGVDPLGGAGVHYWGAIAERYHLQLTVVNDAVDPTFRFMPVDWDGQIRMDPSSTYAMQNVIAMKDRFDLCLACDTDYDRHGVVTRNAGLMPPNQYLCVMVSYLFQHRPLWTTQMAVGKTVVSSQLIDRITVKLARQLYEVPVGFKWFVPGLHDGSLGFGGEESAGAAFACMDGSLWTTDKDGMVPALLAAEIMVRKERDPADIYREITQQCGEPVYARIEAPATADERRILADLSPQAMTRSELAGEPIQSMITQAPGNGAPIGGLKVVTASGWFAARPSGTEAVYKIYAESFLGVDHLHRIQTEAQAMVTEALACEPVKEPNPGQTTHHPVSKHRKRISAAVQETP